MVLKWIETHGTDIPYNPPRGVVEYRIVSRCQYKKQPEGKVKTRLIARGGVEQ